MIMDPQQPLQPIEVLLIEDNPEDVDLIREGLHEGKVAHQLNVVPDGEEAMAYLKGEGRYADAILPDLILLDLRLPKKAGLEVLAEIKADADLRCIPVIVLSSSDAPDDILRAYDLQASCYITKPADLDEFDRVMASLRDFTLTVVKLPPRGAAVTAAGQERWR
jgi:two-component system, chemotaxis family, response regulator Rcp1